MSRNRLCCAWQKAVSRARLYRKIQRLCQDNGLDQFEFA
jgi:hypothetical protein